MIYFICPQYLAQLRRPEYARLSVGPPALKTLHVVNIGLNIMTSGK